MKTAFKITGYISLAHRGGPGAIQVMRNAAKAVTTTIRHAAAGNAIRRPPAEALQCLSKCHACTAYYDPQTERCKHPKCGCYLRLKTHLHAHHCPDGQW